MFFTFYFLRIYINRPHHKFKIYFCLHLKNTRMYLDIFFTRIGLSSRLSFTQLYFKRFENHLPVKLLQNVIIELIKVIFSVYLFHSCFLSRDTQDITQWRGKRRYRTLPYGMCKISINQKCKEWNTYVYIIW